MNYNTFQFVKYLIACLRLCPLKGTRRHIPDHSNLHIQARVKFELQVVQNVETN